jgi:hypothetical protein
VRCVILWGDAQHGMVRIALIANLFQLLRASQCCSPGIAGRNDQTKGTSLCKEGVKDGGLLGRVTIQTSDQGYGSFTVIPLTEGIEDFILQERVRVGFCVSSTDETTDNTEANPCAFCQAEQLSPRDVRL